jgi:hypothetical protein
MVIKGKFAKRRRSNGSDLLAIPDYARTNRDGAAQTGDRGPRPLSSIAWIEEG